MDENEQLYWSVMDVCADVEEGVNNHTSATDKIMTLFESYIISLKTKEQRL